MIPKRTAEVLIAVESERRRQDEKWGEQDHTGSVWALILGEEVGEANKRVLENMFGPRRDERPDLEGAFLLRAELVQVAAVAVAWIEAIDRHA